MRGKISIERGLCLGSFGVAVALTLFVNIQIGFSQEELATGKVPQFQSVPPDSDPIEFLKPAPSSRAAHPLSAEQVMFKNVDGIGEDRVRSLIESQLSYLYEHGVTSARADDTAFFLASALRELGYGDALVNWNLTTGGGLVLSLEKGQSMQLGEISSGGNTEVSSEAIADLLMLKPKSTAKKLALEELPYVRADVEDGISELQRIYKSLGYLDAEVTFEEIASNGKMGVAISIVEGPGYSISAVKMVNEPPSAIKQGVDALIKEFLGTAYLPGTANVLKGRVIELYTNNGYSFAEVKVDVPSFAGAMGKETVAVTLTVTVEKGQQLRLGEVTFSGHSKIKGDFLATRFEALKGNPYHPAEINERVGSLLETGAFESIEYKSKPNVEKGAMDVDIAISEGKTKELGLFGGFGSWEGYILGLVFRNYNFSGSARLLDAKLEMTGRGPTADIGISDPWVFDGNARLSARLFADRTENEGYTDFSVGGRLELRREFTEHTSASIFGEVIYGETVDYSIMPVDELGPLDYRVHALGFSVIHDGRDNPALPTEGFYFSAAFDYASQAFGSDIEGLRGINRLSYYQPLGPLNLHLSARSGFVIPTGTTDQLPIDLRFFSGGANTVRSFSERELGRTDPNGHPLGGEFFSTFNAELSVPIYGNFKAAAFADAGNLLKNFEDASLDEMHYAAGVGLRYDLPVGPIRLDYGWNMNRAASEPAGAFHFSIGFSF